MGEPPELQRDRRWRLAAWSLRVGYLGHDLPTPRPGFWSMRFMLLHDTVHALPSSQPS